jgi:hypothetical protein
MNNDKKPLGLIIHERMLLEEDTEQAGGELTDELERIWEDNQTELADKVDAYAFTLDQLEAVKSTLRDRKRKADDIICRTDSAITRIKKRLNHYCMIISGPLRGHEYTFHPFDSVKREVIVGRVEDQYKKVRVEMPLNEWRKIKPYISAGVSFNTEYPPIKISDLPEGHPAVRSETTPSVRRR